MSARSEAEIKARIKAIEIEREPLRAAIVALNSEEKGLNLALAEIRFGLIIGEKVTCKDGSMYEIADIGNMHFSQPFIKGRKVLKDGSLHKNVTHIWKWIAPNGNGVSEC